MPSPAASAAATSGTAVAADTMRHCCRVESRPSGASCSLLPPLLQLGALRKAGEGGHKRAQGGTDSWLNEQKGSLIVPAGLQAGTLDRCAAPLRASESAARLGAVQRSLQAVLLFWYACEIEGQPPLQHPALLQYMQQHMRMRCRTHRRGTPAEPTAACKLCTPQLAAGCPVRRRAAGHMPDLTAGCR